MTTSDAEIPAPTRTRSARRPASAGDLILKWGGILCLVFASGLAGYIGWTLWGTGLTTQHAQEQLRPGFVGRIGTKTGRPPPPDRLRLPGTAYAEIVIPRIDLDMIVVEDTDEAALEKGPGHYVDTADPWQETGRVGIAGHRTTYLHPFGDLDQLQVGDEITLRTEYGTFDYVVNDVFVLPAAGSGKVLAQTARPTLVLTTCHPEYSAAQRLIVTANRV
ncbi:MAG: class E sortase [Actinobacteria bacterium]|nr:class E sortase [Actinomycetota bacterium]